MNILAFLKDKFLIIVGVACIALGIYACVVGNILMDSGHKATHENSSVYYDLTYKAIQDGTIKTANNVYELNVLVGDVSCCIMTFIGITFIVVGVLVCFYYISNNGIKLNHINPTISTKINK